MKATRKKKDCYRYSTKREWNRLWHIHIRICITLHFMLALHITAIMIAITPGMSVALLFKSIRFHLHLSFSVSCDSCYVYVQHFCCCVNVFIFPAWSEYMYTYIYTWIETLYHLIIVYGSRIVATHTHIHAHIYTAKKIHSHSYSHK